MNPVTEADEDASDQERITNHAQNSPRVDSDLSNVKKLEERVQTLEQRSMFEMPQMGEGTHMPNEVQLRERKRNNLILFGLHEVGQDGGSDQDLVATLFDDLGIEIDLAETSIIRVGRACAGGWRPIIIKLKNRETKAHILFKAKNLKNNAKWKGISIAHDLTKMQCQEAKAMEMRLRKTAHEKNAQLTESQRSEKIWKIVGGRGNRRLMLADV